MADVYECYGLVWGLRKPQRKHPSQMPDLLEVPNPPEVDILKEIV